MKRITATCNAEQEKRVEVNYNDIREVKELRRRDCEMRTKKRKNEKRK